jgi:hypothetical protein
LLVVLHDLSLAHVGVRRVLSGLAPGPSLSLKIPALIQLNLDMIKPLALVVRQLSFAVVALEKVLLGDQLIDLPGDLRIVHVRLLPAPVPIVTDATSVFLA